MLELPTASAKSRPLRSVLGVCVSTMMKLFLPDLGLLGNALRMLLGCTSTWLGTGMKNDHTAGRKSIEK
jgi:hypothetical protein